MIVSLLDSLWVSFIQISTTLGLSTALSLSFAWICTRNHKTAKIAQIIFRWLIYLLAIVPVILYTSFIFSHFPVNIFPQYTVTPFMKAIFMSTFVFITLYTILDFQKAEKDQNYWYTVIPNISLGMRIGLLLSWPLWSLDALVEGKGMGLFIWEAYNYGGWEAKTSGVFGVTLLAFLLDQTIDLSTLLLCRILNSNQGNYPST